MRTKLALSAALAVVVFRAFDKARVPYRLCVRKSGDRQRCRDRHTRKPGQVSRTRFDIDGAVSTNRGWLAGDGVHVNATGYQARARAIARQVERC